MDTTECLGLPFPECAPPLTKDASDIAQFQELAEATDSAVQGLDDAISATLLNPPMARMNGGQNAAGQDLVQFYGGFVDFDNFNMADTVADGIRIQQDGWYMIGGSVEVNTVPAGTSIGLRTEPLVNGDTVSSRQGPGFSAISGEEVNWTDVVFLREGDFLNTMTHHFDNPLTVFTYTVSLWAMLVISNV